MVLAADRGAATAQGEALALTGGYARFAFTAMGSPCEVLFAASSRSAAVRYRATVLDWLDAFEQKYSRFIPGSLVSRIASAAGQRCIEVDPDTEALFALCDWFHWMTEGLFDPTAGPLLALWDHHNAPSELPSAKQVIEAKALTGWPRLQREGGKVRLPKRGMTLDLGGIGKEYAVDMAIKMAEDAGIRDLMVNFGNDVRVAGTPPQGGRWAVGLESPLQPGSCWCRLAVESGSVCTSGNYLRHVEIGGKRYGHILDPRTGQPVDNGALAVSVVAPSCTEAGILSTSAFILGHEEGLQLLSRQFGVEGAIFTREGVYQTGGFQRHVA